MFQVYAFVKTCQIVHLKFLCFIACNFTTPKKNKKTKKPINRYRNLVNNRHAEVFRSEAY